MAMRWNASVAMALLGVLWGAGAADADVTLARLAVIGPLSADGQPSAFVSDKSTSGPANHPYYARRIMSRNDRGDQLASLGFSSLPFQISRDPRTSMLVYSQCVVATGGSASTCAILRQPLVGATGRPIPVSQPDVGVRDRLPAAYGGGVAFSRTAPGSEADVLLYTGAGGTSPKQLPVGPRGHGRAEALGVALRGTQVAYIWRWNTSTGRRYALRTVSVSGDKARTVLTLPSSRGRLIGPVFSGRRIMFVLRRGLKSRLYEYDLSGRIFRSAGIADRVGAFTTAGKQLFWQTASSASIDSGSCGSAKCTLVRGRLPAMRRSDRPR